MDKDGILKDTRREDTDSVKEVIEMKPLPAPRLVKYRHNLPGG